MALLMNICIIFSKKSMLSFLSKVHKDCELFDFKRGYKLIIQLRNDIKKLTIYSGDLKGRILIQDERINVLERQISQSHKQIDLTACKPNITEIKPSIYVLKTFIMNLPKKALFSFIFCISIIIFLTILNIFLSFDILL